MLEKREEEEDGVWKKNRVKTRHMGGSEGEEEELGWERGYS